MSNTECKIQMVDLYFSKYDFKQDRQNNNNEYTTSFKIEYAIGKDDSKVKITIDTSVSSKTESVVLNLQTVGIFKIDKSDLDEKTYNHLVKLNTVAIIFPFIRSQISLLTTQPGINPIMIQPINLNALIESQEK